MTVRILVVEHQCDAGLGFLAERFAVLGARLHTVGPDTGFPVPGSLTGFDALIVLGGAMGPLDDVAAPWLPATRALMVQAVRENIPVLGVCLGAQLLAVACGGVVTPVVAGPEVGLHSIRFLSAAAADPLFAGFEYRVVPVVQWHWLECSRLPVDATLLAGSAACANQVFRVGDAAWGLQFHPEALGRSARAWRELEDLAAVGLDAESVVAGVVGEERRLRDTWQCLADRFYAAAVTGLRG